MTISPAPTPATPAAEEPTRASLRDLLAEQAHLAAFQAVVEDHVKLRRAALQARLLESYRESGAKSFSAIDADQVTLAQVTLRENNAKMAVTDTKAYEAWVVENHPTEIEMVTSVKDAFTKALIKRCEVRTVVIDTNGAIIKGAEATDDGIIDTTSGELIEGASEVTAVVDTETETVVEGLAMRGGGEPTSFGMTWKDGAKEKVLGNLVSMSVADMVALPAGEDV